jgi:hypothetical protein
MLAVGQRVRFVGRKYEIEQYHPDFAQLLGEVGTVVEIGVTFLGVKFEGFTYIDGTGADNDCFPCLDYELEAVT